jgi:predicted nucleic acid-binding protein
MRGNNRSTAWISLTLARKHDQRKGEVATLTAYDAAYVTLAEVRDATLLTSDRGIASAPGHHANVEIV